MSLQLTLPDSLPDKVGSPLRATEQQRSRAQDQSISRNFDEAFLLDTDPVWEQTQLHVMDNGMPTELVATAIGDVGASGLRPFLCAPAKKISCGELRAVGSHDGHGHVSVLAVHDVADGILAKRITDLSTETPVLPGQQSPCADKRIGCPRLSLAPCVSTLAQVIMPA